MPESSFTNSIPGGGKAELKSSGYTVPKMPVQPRSETRQVFNGGINVQLSAPEGKINQQEATSDIKQAVKTAMRELDQEKRENNFAFAN